MSCAGPLGVSIRDLELVFRLVAEADPWRLDEDVLAVPWRSLKPLGSGTRLTVGVMPEDRLCPLHPPMRRAVESAKRALTAAGHTCVSLEGLVPDLHESLVLICKFFMNDNRGTVMEHIAASGEPGVASLSTVALKELKDWKIGLDDVFEMFAEREAVRKAWRKVWAEKQLDVVIGAPNAGTAQRHDRYGAPPYTCLANLIDVSIWLL